MENIYVVTGATGNTGSKVADKLLENGRKVIVIARHEDKLKELSGKGAKAMAGDVLDAEFLKNAFKEANALYAMIPPNYTGNDYLSHYKNVSDSIVKAVESSEIKNIVALSSIGAELPEGTGIVEGLHYLEEKLKSLRNINILILRPGYFMENLFSQIDIIKNMGVLGSPTKGDLPIEMVCTKDIAEVAAKHLDRLDFKGFEVKYILGQRVVTFNEVAKVLGKAIGKDDLKYVQFSYEDAINGMVQSGLSKNTAEGFVGLSKFFNAGKSDKGYSRSAENTVHTSIEEFSKTFAEVYNSKR
ncbi:MAG: SDR family NAD(P)-dependent oxidoreductase [Bacteroidota bacterium]|nr:SDR family NAD(P)-dependent oxidoreductase [Bacteroidota bacterium]MDP4196008.1 SDR family NAD(P)-dependent oxidoreductase [Bacteroidota bacterium]